MREQLRKVVQSDGVAEVARSIPCGRTTLFRLLKGESVPSLPTQDCIERLIDDRSMRSFVGIRRRDD